jgi:mannose-6-phosphate isomerase-like protein (cupin superfamily)
VIDVRSLGTVDPFVTKDGSLIRELCGVPAGGTSRHSVAEATLEPGQATERHYHGESEEVYFILEGEGDMEVDGDSATVCAGDAIPISPGAWHTLRNTGGGPLRLLCTCAPPYRHEDTFFE